MSMAIYEANVTRERYENLSGLNYSSLKVFAEDPELYYRRFVVPSLPGRSRETPAMTFGKDVELILKKLVLGGSDEIYDPRIVHQPEAFFTTKGKVTTSKNSLEYRNWRKGHPDDARVMDAIQFNTHQKTMRAVAEQVAATEIAAHMILGSDHDVGIQYQCPQHGVEHKGLLDYACQEQTSTHLAHRGVRGPYVADLKTTARFAANAWPSEIIRWKYHWQAALYSRGMKIAMDLQQDPEFYHIVVESLPPYRVDVRLVDEVWIEIAHEEMSRHIAAFKNYDPSGESVWRRKGFGKVSNVSPPHWYLQNHEFANLFLWDDDDE